MYVLSCRSARVNLSMLLVLLGRRRGSRATSATVHVTPENLVPLGSVICTTVRNGRLAVISN